MFDEAMKKYNESNSDYDPGICEGLKRIIDIMEGEIWLKKKMFLMLLKENVSR